MTVKKLLIAVSIVVVVGIVGVLAVSSVFAQTATPEAPATPKAFGGRGGGFGFGFFGGGSTALFDAEAKALNLTPTQLFEQLHSGKTLTEIAQAQGVDLTKVQDAVKAARIQAMKDQINQAVKDGQVGS